MCESVFDGLASPFAGPEVVAMDRSISTQHTSCMHIHFLFQKKKVYLDNCLDNCIDYYVRADALPRCARVANCLLYLMFL